jgi:hypothetical protein
MELFEPSIVSTAMARYLDEIGVVARLAAMAAITLIGLAAVSGCRPATPVVAATSRGTELPPAIQKLRTVIADMNPKQAEAAVVARFGPPTRRIGSGISIPQWVFPEGILTVHPDRGPTFRFADGRIVWLLPTSNPAGEAILRQFEMDTLPDPANHRTRFYVGAVHITPDRRYRFLRNEFDLAEQGDQSANFFVTHPSGSLQIEWIPGVTADTPLESVAAGPVATLNFVADDGSANYRCVVVSSAQTRRLVVADSTFQLETAWLHWWRDGARR